MMRHHDAIRSAWLRDDERRGVEHELARLDAILDVDLLAIAEAGTRFDELFFEASVIVERSYYTAALNGAVGAPVWYLKRLDELRTAAARILGERVAALRIPKNWT